MTRTIQKSFQLFVLLIAFFFAGATSLSAAGESCGRGGVCSATPCSFQNLDSIPGACSSSEQCCVATIGAPGETGVGGITNPVIAPERGNDIAGAKSGSLFTKLLINMWRAFITVGALLVLLALVTGAIDWITSNGEKGKVDSARNKMTTAVVGFVILVTSFTIISVIGQIMGFDLLRLTFPVA